MKLLVLSDLHLTHQGFDVIHEGKRVDETADVVVLAGDIHESVAGVRWARESFPDKPIVMVAGNHEFYGSHWTRQIDDMREAANKYDIEFLEANAIDLAGVRFLGCTLWTNFEVMGVEKSVNAMRHAKSNMNDYHYIKISRTAETHWAESKYLVPELSRYRHAASVEWLEKKLVKGTDPAKTVVVTHHAPHPNSIIDRYKTNLLSTAYASDLTHLMGKAGLWIHGHIHSSADYNVDGTRVVSNPKGYQLRNGGQENTHFNPACIVEI